MTYIVYTNKYCTYWIYLDVFDYLLYIFIEFLNIFNINLANKYSKYQYILQWPLLAKKRAFCYDLANIDCNAVNK